MPLLACGLNHQTAPLHVREQLAFAPEAIAYPLAHLVHSGAAKEAAILSTCNRTEIYCETDNYEHILHFLSTHGHIPKATLARHVYTHQSQDAIRHMLRVASGLDSMALGESQILGQMKQAFQTAANVGTLGPQLKRLSHYLFATSKKVRTQTTLGSHSVSLAYTSVLLAKRLFNRLADNTALLIGAGDTIELIAKHLSEQNIQHLIIANRSLSRAQSLAERFHAEPILLQALPEHLSRADLVFSATASPLPILGKGSVERAIKHRKHKPMFMVDLACPRDIEVEVGKLSDVYLYDLDALNTILNDNRNQQKLAALHAEDIINLHTSHYVCWERSLAAIPIIKEYREQCNTLRDSELAKFKRALDKGAKPEAVLAEFARSLTNKLMHHPCEQLRQAGFDGDYDLLEHAKQILDTSGAL